MSIPGSVNPLFLGAAGQATGGGGYQIERSVRFNSPDSAYLSRTPASSSNRKTWTFAAWVKRAKLGGTYTILGSRGTTPNEDDSFQFNFTSSDVLAFSYGNGTWKTTTQVFRDCSAWYHLTLAFDSTQATAANRIKLYVNGIQVTSFTVSSDTTLNLDSGINKAVEHRIGSYASAAPLTLDGCIADVFLIDSQALDPSSFGEFDTNGVWQPIDASGLTFGTNGFRLPFSDNSTAAALGTDTSNNGHTWTVNNISVITGGPTSVAAASGALPVYNTTDTYGATKGTGTRTDSNSSSIVLAVPMDGANNGTTFTDEHATIKGSGSAKSITRNGDTKTSTSQSKFYGSSGYFDGTGDYLSVASTADFAFSGNFAVECFVYFTALNPSDNASYITDFRAGSTSNFTFGVINIGGTCKLYAYVNGSDVTGSTGLALNTWHHVAYTRSGSTLTVYLNGVADATLSTAFSQSSTSLVIGARHTTSTEYVTGYIQDLRIYKGVAKYTSNFNPPSSTQNATIAAGNDSLVDSPTNGSQVDTGAGGSVRGNYATINPLSKAANASLSNGNLDVTNTVSGSAGCASAIGMSSGKWYCEVTVNAVGSETKIGICKENAIQNEAGSVANSWAYGNNGEKFNTNVNISYGNSFTTGDVIGIAFDADAGSLYFYKNGTVQNSGTAAYTSLTSGPYFFQFTARAVGSANNLSVNFGQRQWAYAAPAGFKALCTANLPEPTIADGSTVMDVALYTGNGSTQTISGLNFSPDLVWIKARNIGYWHRLIDSVRGAQKFLYSNVTDAEGTSTANDIFTSFDSTGFTLGGAAPSADGLNQNTQPYVAWTWDAGSSTVTNTQGSISSQVRANASAGFSVVSYVGTQAAATVGHGLGVAPSFIIAKCRGTGDSEWAVYHRSLASGDILRLNNTVAAVSSTNTWDSTAGAPTSTVFRVNNSTWSNASGQNMIAYCFAPVAGYSAYGSYTGNGSANGPFVFTGMRPRWVMLKSATQAYRWYILDSARNTYNVANGRLFANSSVAEATNSIILDFTSSGFKIRTDDSEINGGSQTIIYACFAEHPLATARAR